MPHDTTPASRAIAALIVGLLSSAAVASADTSKLTVYTCDSFVSEWGAGPGIEEAFESQCNCRLDFIGLDGAPSIL